MRFGLAVRDITPTVPVPMYGYMARQDHFDGVHEPLTFTALVLEEDGRRALIGAADLGTMPYDGTAQLRHRLGEIVGCPASHVLLNASHTHGGPLVSTGSILGPPRADNVPKYESFLFEQVERAAVEALGCLREGRLSLHHGRTSVPLNRRLERDGDIVFAPNPDGPVDDRLTVFCLHEADGRLAGLGIRVSCHPTATGGKHRINGDFVGAWKQSVAEAVGPDVVPFFLQGSGADAKPRHSARDGAWTGLQFEELEPLSRTLNREILQAVTASAPEVLDPLALVGHDRTVTVRCEPRLTDRAAVEHLVEHGNVEQALCAAEYLKMMDRGEAIRESQDYLVQTLWLTRELALVGIDAEVLCGTGAQVEAAAAPGRALVLGYSNGNGGYVPDAREIARGGYERDSFIFRGLSGPPSETMAEQFAEAVVGPDADTQPG